MGSISSRYQEKCPRCGSGFVSLEWDERFSRREVQNLWRCCQCKNEFITVVTSEEKEPSVAEVTKPFFTSLLME